jgi:hypothetical protein
MLKVPSLGLGIVVLVNRSDVWSFDYTNKILDACLVGLDPVPTTQAYGPFANGVFRSPKTGRVIELWEKDDQQLISVDGADLGALERDDRGVLELAGYGKYMKKSMTLAGAPDSPSAVHLTDFGNSDELMRVPPNESLDESAILGRYRSDATGTDAAITKDADGVRMMTYGRFGAVEFSLKCLTHGVWRAKVVSEGVILPPSSMLSFEDDGKAFSYSNILTRALPFRRVN